MVVVRLGMWLPSVFTSFVWYFSTSSFERKKFSSVFTVLRTGLKLKRKTYASFSLELDSIHLDVYSAE